MFALNQFLKAQLWEYKVFGTLAPSIFMGTNDRQFSQRQKIYKKAISKTLSLHFVFYPTNRI